MTPTVERREIAPGLSISRVLTGLWQIVGRAETEFDERLRLDIAYIERQGLWFDMYIMFQTVAAVVKQRGAH